MRLTIVLPSRVALDEPVAKVRGRGRRGAFCLLPRHVDVWVMLVPGILSYEASGAEHFVALDGGTLVKIGGKVRVSTPHLVQSGELGELRDAVAHTFAVQDERQRQAQAALRRMEADFIRRFLDLQDYSYGA